MSNFKFLTFSKVFSINFCPPNPGFAPHRDRTGAGREALAATCHTQKQSQWRQWRQWHRGEDGRGRASRQQLQRIFLYNRDDSLATWAVVRWLLAQT